MTVPKRKEFRYSAYSLKLTREIKNKSLNSTFIQRFALITIQPVTLYRLCDHREIIDFMFCVHGITLRTGNKKKSSQSFESLDNNDRDNFNFPARKIHQLGI